MLDGFGVVVNIDIILDLNPSAQRGRSIAVGSGSHDLHRLRTVAPANRSGEVLDALDEGGIGALEFKLNDAELDPTLVGSGNILRQCHTPATSVNASGQ